VNAFIPPYGKLVSYIIAGPYTGKLEPPPTMADEVFDTDKRRMYVRLGCPDTLRVTFRDPASPDFQPTEWVDVTVASAATNGVEFYYTGPIWVQSNDDIHVIVGY